jgi:hypothetical protein
VSDGRWRTLDSRAARSRGFEYGRASSYVMPSPVEEVEGVDRLPDLDGI